MPASDMFRLSENIRGQDYLLATYYIELPAEADILAKAASYAVGQTIGTWVEVPGVTAEMRDRHLGRVVKVLEAPPVDLGTQSQETSGYFMQIALPTVNIGPSIPMLLATAIGNDVSTSVQAKLVDLEVPDSMAEELVGPRFGIEGVRKLVGVHDRPLVLNMIKPCTGLTPEAGAQIFYETALGGVDLIKDDELMGNPSFSPVVDRVKAYLAAGERARDETGRDVVYFPNVTDRADRMIDTARRAVDAGARGVMCAYASVGYGGLQALSEVVGVPILAHYAAAGPYFEGPGTGMSAPLALGLLPRLAGGDLAITITPYGGYPLRRLQYLKMIQQLTLPRPHVAPVFPVIGGGVHPGTVETYMGELGNDIVLGAGGAIQGHPDGAAAGADAMRQAIDAVMSGQRVVDAAQEHPELAHALEKFGATV
jgi:2,3-diketo-5-methylthiopentyl-1-phosphate enolase